MVILVDSAFDSGNFVAREVDDCNIAGSMTKDPALGCCQWFCFTVSCDKSRDVLVRIEGADQAFSREAWRNYEVCSRHEIESQWRRNLTRYADGTLSFTLAARAGKTSVAYFEPYPLSRYASLHARLRCLPVECHETVIPLSGGLHSLSVFRLAAAEPRTRATRRVWIIARQHPGETAAAWFIEAWCRLLEREEAFARMLFDEIELFLVPNMNPGGVARGYHRVNEHGFDLNRQWLEPECDEVRTLRALIAAHPPHVFLDVHGDEASLLPYFISEAKGPRGAASAFHLSAPWGRLSGSADPRVARNFIQQTFGGVAATLELPTQYNSGNLFSCSSSVLETMVSLARGVSLQLLGN